MSKLTEMTLEYFQQGEAVTAKIETIYECIYELPGLHYLTALNGSLLAVNRNIIIEAGVSDSQILGRSVFCEASRMFEAMYRRLDNVAKQQERVAKGYEVCASYDGRVFSVLTHKKPVYHNGQLFAVLGCSLESPAPAESTNETFTPDTIFFDSSRGAVLNVTAKQGRILFYLLKGMTAREIADCIFLSKRTVEHHIEAIKDTQGYASSRDLCLSICAF